MFQDPVCGMQVEEDSSHRTSWEGAAYRFCSAGCLSKFEADPQRYLGASPAADPPAADPGALYLCPMHPEVQQRGPGTCPKCGMALEPARADAEEDSSELDDMTRRLLVSAPLAAVVMLLAMSDLLPGQALRAWLPPDRIGAGD
ncbi:MAG: YHS domain-containing protein [Myxococcota bacterium]